MENVVGGLMEGQIGGESADFLQEILRALLLAQDTIKGQVLFWGMVIIVIIGVLVALISLVALIM